MENKIYILICGFSLFWIAFLFHWIIWRFHIPKNPIGVLLLIFYSILFLGLFVLWYYQIGSTLFTKMLLLEYLHISIFFSVMTFSYCLVYQALIDYSPSLFAVVNIFNSGEKGMSQAELGHLITDDLFIKPRVDFLVDEKMAYKCGDRYFLSRKGYKFLRVFISIQKLMDLRQKAA